MTAHTHIPLALKVHAIAGLGIVFPKHCRMQRATEQAANCAVSQSVYGVMCCDVWLTGDSAGEANPLQ
jgi:hypothetical protein